MAKAKSLRCSLLWIFFRTIFLRGRNLCALLARLLACWLAGFLLACWLPGWLAGLLACLLACLPRIAINLNRHLTGQSGAYCKLIGTSSPFGRRLACSQACFRCRWLSCLLACLLGR